MWTSNISLGAILNIDSSRFAFTNFEVSSLYVDQVTKLFHIDLHQRQFESKLNVLRGISNLVKNLFDHAWYKSLKLRVLDAWPHAREGFSGGSLSIGKDSAIDTLENTKSA